LRLARLKTEGVTPAEVTRALSKGGCRHRLRSRRFFAIASQLNEDIAVGDWAYYFTLPERISAVTVADVNRVAKAYLQEDQSTTGWFVPLSTDPVAEETAADRSSLAPPGTRIITRDQKWLAARRRPGRGPIATKVSRLHPPLTGRRRGAESPRGLPVAPLRTSTCSP